MKEFLEKLVNIGIHVKRFSEYSELGGVLGYRKSNLDELTRVHAIYKQIIVLEHNISTNIDINNKNLAQSALRDILEIDPKEKRPKATLEQIAESFVFRNTMQKGELSVDCENAFNVMKISIEQRLNNANYEQVNSAIVLFCAEFLAWLKELAASRCTLDVKQEILNRITYLETILAEGVFPDETHNDYAIHLIIFNVINILEKHILPRVIWKLQEFSAREHFENLIIHADAYVRYSINALFTLYTESKEIFQFDLITYDSSKNRALQSALNTRFGDTLKLFAGLQEALSPHAQRSSNIPLVIMNCFLDARGFPSKDLLKVLKTDNSSSSRPLGIHIVMRNNKLIEHLILTFGCLYDFGVLLYAFRQAYNLCGRGGDYLMYVALGQQTNDLMAAYAQLIQRSQYCLSVIQKSCWELYQRHIENFTEQEWRQHYLIFRSKSRVVNIEINVCHNAMLSILKGLEDSFSLDYEKRIKQEMREFCTLVQLIKNRTLVSVTESTEATNDNTQILTTKNTAQSTPSMVETDLSVNRDKNNPRRTFDDTISVQALLNRTQRNLERIQMSKSSSIEQSSNDNKKETTNLSIKK